MADWSTIASVGTAVGTLVLAIATYASVRSAKRSAQASERALLAAIRPVLVSSRLEDPAEKVGFVDQHWVKVAGGRGIVEVTDEAIYMVIALRNVGCGSGGARSLGRARRSSEDRGDTDRRLPSA